jgi:hypothetical protein
MLNLLLTVVQKKISFIIISGLLLGSPNGKAVPGSNAGIKVKARKVIPNTSVNVNLYQQLGIAGMGLKQEVFQRALAGWNALKARNELPKSGLLSIVDLSQSANSKRLYVIDVAAGKVLFNTLVAHGRNSGEEFAKSFSNTPESYKSSLGFYITGGTYTGKHGLSLRLRGLENGYNNLAENRAIVIHGADYVSENFIKQHGRLGRSQGCPAVPVEMSEPIINAVKDGSCVFVYHPDQSYLKHSALLRQNNS